MLIQPSDKSVYMAHISLAGSQSSCKGRLDSVEHIKAAKILLSTPHKLRTSWQRKQLPSERSTSGILGWAKGLCPALIYDRTLSYGRQTTRLTARAKGPARQRKYHRAAGIVI